VRDGRVDVVDGEGGARGVLVEDVAEDAELDGLARDLEGGGESLRLVVSQVELAEQHRLRGLVERRPRGEPLLCPSRPCRGVRAAIALWSMSSGVDARRDAGTGRTVGARMAGGADGAAARLAVVTSGVYHSGSLRAKTCYAWPRRA